MIPSNRNIRNYSISWMYRMVILNGLDHRQHAALNYQQVMYLSSISYRSVDNDTREDNIGVKKEGSRLPIQVHSHPHIDEVIQSTTITPYKASQFSYLRTPAESIYHAKAHKSST